MTAQSDSHLLQFDRDHIWHPYSSIHTSTPLYGVRRAQAAMLELFDGTQLVDGMSSWWSAIHGYNHPRLNQALHEQANNMAHVMFGGLTHSPAIRLAEQLIALTPESLQRVFFADSGSVAVEVALKMALQYWLSRGNSSKTKFISFRSGYHGDTLGAMAVCDPITGMHHLFSHVLPQNIFVEAPATPFGQPTTTEHLQAIEQALAQYHQQVAAVVIEPIVQGAGGMRFYSADFLKSLKALCEQYKVLLIADEIATGFGRTGELFACNHAEITPDILCLGKALTGGYMTLAATLCTEEVARGICDGEAGVFMHGPTFMANPLACHVASTSIDLLIQSPWQTTIANIEQQLKQELEPCRELQTVADVRVLGAIGVVEMHTPVDMATIIPAFVAQGIWLRPFGKLVYTMPPYIITSEELTKITRGIHTVLTQQEQH